MRTKRKTIVFAVILIGGTAGMRAAAPPSNLPAPAKVVSEPNEEKLANVILTEKAEQRLAITTAAMARKPMPRIRTYGAEVVFAAGKMTAGDIGAILPAMTPDAIAARVNLQIDADAAIETAAAEWEASKIDLAFEKQLLAAKTGTVKAVNDSQARLDRAEAQVKAARAKREFLGDSLRGATLDRTVWLRASVYGGDRIRLDREKPATVRELSARPDTEGIAAKPIVGAPVTRPGSAAIDLFYELDNSKAGFVFGQRVAISIPLKGEAESLVVPWSAVLFDVHGGTWVYEQLAPQNYVRRRIDVQYVKDGLAALARGPKVGAKIVTAGAIELFGTEFGVGK